MDDKLFQGILERLRLIGYDTKPLIKTLQMKNPPG
jgi:hypothetical protein